MCSWLPAYIVDNNFVLMLLMKTLDLVVFAVPIVKERSYFVL